MRILFVLDKLPYPPRDGETVPTFNDLIRLSRGNDVSLLILHDKGIHLEKRELVANRQYVQDFWVVKRKKMSKPRAIINELTLRNPYFLSWRYDERSMRAFMEDRSFEVVWVSPFINADVIFSVNQILQERPSYICVPHDCTTAMLRSMKKLAGAGKKEAATTVNGVQRWLRSWLMAPMEAKILDLYDLVVMQTEKDKDWLARISRGRLNRKVLIAPNGVEDVLFDIPIDRRGKDILYFGSLGEWAQYNFLWFLEQVWPEVRSFCEDTRLFVVSRNAPQNIVERLAMDERIQYRTYLADIKDVFRNKALSVAPIFKNFGLINKVVESMAAGVPVVGDSGSFNGIPDFQGGWHGIVANDRRSTVEGIRKLLDCDAERFDMAHRARELVRDHFSWEKRAHVIQVRLSEVIEEGRNIVRRSVVRR